MVLTFSWVQRKLCDSAILVVGAGGLGSAVALYLAAAGVGKLGIADQDEVDLSNLHRQVLHGEDRIGQHKAVSAASTLRRLNSKVNLELHVDGFRSVSPVHIYVLENNPIVPISSLAYTLCVGERTRDGFRL